MLPKNLKYQTRVESAPARSLRTNIAPQNGTGTYGFGDTIIINIPTRQNLCLNTADSYLKFDVDFQVPTVANQAIRWDSCGAHSVIQRLRIFSGSNLLQDIENYNMLAKILFDLQVPGDAAYGKMSILAGTRPDLITQLPAITALDTVAGGRDPAGTTAAQIGTAITTLATNVNTNIQTVLSNANRQSLQINSGELLQVPGADNGYTTLVGTGVAGPPAVAAVTPTYCLNLISLLGTLSSQYFPLFACTSSPIRLELQLAPNAVSCINSAVSLGANPVMRITNCEYVANMIELSDSAMSMIQSSLNGQPLQYVVPDYRNYQFTQGNLTNTNTVLQVPIPAKFSSVKSLILSIRDKPATLNYFPFSSTKTGITSYTFRIGANVFPQKPPDRLPEMFAELLKSISSISNLDHHPAIERFTYNLDASVQCNSVALMTNSSSGSFYIGIDLENYANSSGSYRESVFSGYNTNTEDIYAVINLTPPTATTSVRIDAFAMFDEVLVFENNTCFARF